MNLHLNKETFKQFINKISSETNIGTDILEKDYYVCCILNELAMKQDEFQAYFKGGTAIYKILETMNRFSEDIDLTVKVKEGLSNSQKKKTFEKTDFDYHIEGLRLNKEKNIKNGRSEVAFYDYDSVFTIDTEPLQRAGEIQVESTSFTVSEPVEDAVIEPIIYKYASEAEKEILKNNFSVKEIKIKIIKLERMFIDKIFAAEFYYTRKEYKDTAKHIYDISILLSNDKIKKLLINDNEIRKLVGYKRLEEELRTEGVSKDIKIRDFSYLECKFDKDFIENFNSMQNKYITNEKYKLEIEEVKEKLKFIKNKFIILDM